jgi:hypothetical protein
MANSNRQHLRPLWIGLALILPLLHLYHAVPHAHANQVHAQPEETPASHAEHGHSHSHSHDAPEPKSPGKTHHHHSLDDHFNSSPVRVLDRQMESDPASSFCVYSTTNCPPDSEDAELVEQESGQPPGTVLTSDFGARAPPLQG